MKTSSASEISLSRAGAVSDASSLSRLDHIDALRGFACLWVVLCHALGKYPVESGWSHAPLWVLVKVSEVGWIGVSLFLVLSGFCLYYPLVRRHEPAQIRVNLSDFAKRRVRRVLPPYYAAMAFSLVSLVVFARMSGTSLFQLFGGASGFFKNLISSVFLVHNLSPATFVGVVGVSWSLALEAQLYLLFPLMVWFAARRGIKALLGAALVVALVYQSVVFWHIGVSPEWDQSAATWYYAFPARAFEFVCGMGAAALVARPKGDLARAAFVGTVVFGVLGLGYAWLIGMLGPLLHPILGVCFGCLLVWISRVPNELFRQRAVLRALTWVGTMSYSLYLIHEVVFKVVRLDRFHLVNPSDAVLIAFVLLRIGLAVLVGYGFFLCFERPWLVRRKASSSEVIQATALSPAP